MDLIDVIMLVLTGGAAGFAGGLLGIGGGLIFTPVLLFYFQYIGIPDEHVTPLAIGTGLLCTLVVAVASAIGHGRKAAIDIRIAVFCGLASMFAIIVTTIVVTTSDAYTPQLYRIFFSILLVIVAVRMIRLSFSAKDADSQDGGNGGDRLTGKEGKAGGAANLSPARPSAAQYSTARHVASYVLGGSVAGILAAAVGVGGGIILVPLYDRYMGLTIRRAIGTSSATIVLITLVAVIGYMINGAELGITGSSIGYVDFSYSFILSVPAALSAFFGVHYAHKINQRVLRFIFGLLALLVALRLTLDAAGIL